MFSFFAPENTLINAVKHNDVAAVTKMLQTKLDADSLLNEVDDYGWTALHYAAYHNHAEMVKFLLDNGGKRSINSHAHPISDDSMEGFANSFIFNGRETPLMLTTSPAIAALLIKAGANLRERDAAGWDVIYWVFHRTKCLHNTPLDEGLAMLLMLAEINVVAQAAHQAKEEVLYPEDNSLSEMEEGRYFARMV